MTLRDQQLLALRPGVETARVTDATTPEEAFQNQTLRPILKGQNPLLLFLYRLHLQRRKNVFYDLSAEQRYHYIAQSLQKDTSLRSTLRGAVVGQFTEEELAQYAPMASAIDKRISSLLVQRLQSQLSVFRAPD